jgi:beta-lactamase superfamily II metal-dependent hydrolase
MIVTTIISDQCLTHSVPDSNDLEVSVFGPGFGECIAIHLPGGKWILVDSCRNSEGQPATLAYLREMGVEAGSDVAMVVASHWHFDHVDGIAELVRECQSAEPVISQALQARELLAFTKASQYLGPTAPRSIEELRRLTDVVDAASPIRYITTAQARLKLLESRYGTLISSVDALSPSPASVSIAMRQLSQSRLEAGRELEAPRADHNSACVVLRIRSGDVGILLTSDLETRADPARGWLAVVDASGAEAHRSEVIKISHHGSINGDADVIWSHLLAEAPMGIVTHFHNGSVHLPSRGQLEAIAGRCSGLFSTSGPAWTPMALTAEAAAELLAQGGSLSSQPVGLGHVRVRIRPEDESEWHLSVCGPAAAVVGSVVSASLSQLLLSQ